MNDFTKNPDFEDWTDGMPDGWCKLKEDDKLYNIINNLTLRRVYYFNILGIRFIIKGRDLLKVKNGKKYIIDWNCKLK